MKTNIPKIKYLLLIFIILLLYSCDILRFNTFEVTSWSPGEGVHTDPENITVSLRFSLSPNKGSVERNFSLTGNDTQVKGTFSWDGKSMSFIPLTPFEVNTDYTINLTADAHDSKGVSMDNDFTCDFTTKPNHERPVLLSCYPQSYEVIDDLRTEVQLLFSTPIQLNSLYSSVSFTPSMAGSWRLENNDLLAIFTPAEPWSQQTKYEIKYSTSLTDKNGNNIGNNFLSVFNVGTDNEAPYLVSAQRITKNNDYIDLDRYLSNTNTVNENWEKEDKLFLVFSEPVDRITVKNNLSVVGEMTQDTPSLILEAETENEFLFKFDTVPSFELMFSFNLKPGVKDYAGNFSKEEYIFKIFANGQFSRPPELVGFRMPLAPMETDTQFFSAGIDSNFEIITISDKHYPSGTNVPTWIELYFDAAADINIFSLMELFRIDSSNLVLSFSPRSVKLSNFSVPAPQPGWENYQRIEIAGVLTNSVNFGIIYLQIGAGLCDSLGNKNEKSQKISVIK